MKGIRYLSLTLSFFLYILSSCSGNKSLLQRIDKTAPNKLRILEQPRQGMKPPFVFTNELGEEGCVFTDITIDGLNAGNEYDANIQEGLNRKYSAEFFAKLGNDIAPSLNIASELIENLKFDIKARGIKLYRIAPSRVEFKGGRDCINYMTSFKRDNELVLETLGADTLVIDASNLENQELKAKLEAKFKEIFGASLDVVNQAQGKWEYKITGNNLVFGYRAASFAIELYSTENALKITTPLEEEYELSGVRWIRGVRVEPTGDGSTYIVTLFPVVGEKRIKRMQIGDQKDFHIEKHQKMTVALTKVVPEGAQLAIAGFGVTFKE